LVLPLFKVHFPESALEPLKATLLSGYIGQGPKVDEFERALAPWVGSPNGLLVNTCTSAIRLALRLAGVGPGTEVVTTAMTCSATNTPILEQYADPVWADIDPWTGNIDPVDVERKITPKTKAIVAVHWGGYPCDLDALIAISRKYGVALIEDAAHAFGATYRGRKIGSYSSFCCYSFQAIKQITTIEGGLLVCPSVNDYRRGRLLRWYGIDRDTPRADLRCEEDIVEAGMKYNFNDVGAAIGLEQLKYAGGILERHRVNAAFYRSRLASLKRVKLLRYEPDRLSSYWLFTIRVDDRKGFQEFMKQKEIMASQVHVRNDLYTAFKPFRRNLPGVDEFTREQISIPVGWWVSDEDRERVSAAVEEWSRL
jgi:dTDP-4-amino-4,6-dideoxygalactose transaminase